MRSLARSVLLLTAGLLLAGCVSLTATPGTALSPMAGGADTSPLAEPVASAEATRAPGTAILTGQLERFDGTPVKGIIVYPALIEQREDVRLASVDPLVDPRAVTDAEGRFQVINLKPGEYALAMQSPVGIIMPHNTAGQIVTFELTADATTDLGNLPVGYMHPDSE